MIELKQALHTRAVIAGCAVVATVGISAYASAAGDRSKSDSTTGSSPTQPPRAVDPKAAAVLQGIAQKHGLELIAGAMRTIGAPGAKAGAPAWVLAPTREGGLCATTTRVAFCGSSRASVEAGRASATEYPPDRFVGRDPETGNLLVQPSDGTGVRSGIAPSGAVAVAVVDREGRTLRRADVTDGAYEVTVPGQGSEARIAFVDGAGETIASRPVEG